MRFGVRSKFVCVLMVLVGAGTLAAGAQTMTQSFSSSAYPEITPEPGGRGGAGAGAAFSADEEHPANRFQMHSASLPFEYGVIVQSGVGLTEERDDFKFLMAGVHAGKVLYKRDKPGLLHGNFEYAAELFPFWQSYTPKFQRANCAADPSGSAAFTCTSLYSTGGTYSGVTLTPIILRWNFTSGRKIVPWAQAAGGLLWTNHKYPAFGSPILSVQADGPNTDASVWNFTPQGGVGIHYFIRPDRSIDFGANGVHISSASLGDRNPGVNASVQFSLGYTFWK